MNRTEEMYMVESVAGLYALFQGILGVILADKIQEKRIVTLLKKSCSLALLVYPTLLIVRMILYFLLHQALKVIQDDTDKGFGSMFAEYISDSTGSLVLSICLSLTMLIFYCLNIWIIKVTNKMIDF